jgi:flagellin-like protein
MLKRILTQKRYLKHIYKEQRGITGLETAIILIAFVVVAAVFAYTVLSAGLFSTQKSQEAVYSGLQETQGTLEIKGSVVTGGLATINGCNALGTWIDGTHGTVAYTTVAGEYVEGSGAEDITVDAAAVANDTLASASMPQRALAAGDAITLWVKVTTELTGSEVNFAIGPDATLHDDNSQNVVITGADTGWHKYSMTLAGDDTAADNYGFYVTAADPGNAAHIYVDDITIDHPALNIISDPLNVFANSVTFTLALANGGPGIDFTQTTDADSDGDIGDESTKTHKVIVAYSDANQTKSDITWTITKVGKTDSDDILDTGEQFILTVDLTYINQHVTADNQKVDENHQFTLEIKPATGASFIVERTMPDRIQKVTNLN